MDFPHRIQDAFLGYAHYVGSEFTELRWNNFFLWLLGLSVGCFLLEVVWPWARQSALRRKDFWLDGWYLVFNVLVFPLLGFQAVWSLVEQSAQQVGSSVGLNLAFGYLPATWPVVLRLVVLFLVRDFIQWNTHRLLHRVPMFWRFHTIHHSAHTLGFATHFRFHPLETVLYRTLEYVPLALLGVGAIDMTAVYVFTVLVGHLNHTNIRLPLGWARYLFNNPQMHRWHHAQDLPHQYGVNFGLTLSVWDYLFRTAYIPHEAAQEVLGLSDTQPPDNFLSQLTFPFRSQRQRAEQSDSASGPFCRFLEVPLGTP